MEVTEGSYFFTANYSGTSLGVEHLPPHIHGDPSTDPTSYDRGGGRASVCEGTGRNDTCNIGCDPTQAFRVAANPAVHVRVSRGDNNGHLRDNFVWSDRGFTGTGGGGNVQTTTAWAQTQATVVTGGNGICAGNMNCGNNVLFTSRSHDETNAGAEHFHGPNNYNMEGNYQVISPGLRTNIALNTVRINNSPGANFGTINVETATPSLEMLYIIRAF